MEIVGISFKNSCCFSLTSEFVGQLVVTAAFSVSPDSCSSTSRWKWDQQSIVFNDMHRVSHLSSFHNKKTGPFGYKVERKKKKTSCKHFIASHNSFSAFNRWPTHSLCLYKLCAGLKLEWISFWSTEPSKESSRWLCVMIRPTRRNKQEKRKSASFPFPRTCCKYIRNIYKNVFFLLNFSATCCGKSQPTERPIRCNGDGRIQSCVEMRFSSALLM